MRTTTRRFLMAAMALFLAQAGWADDDFYGVIESRPEGKAGTWVIGGRSVQADERTELDEDDGPLVVGACVEVDMEGAVVEEIDREDESRCRK